MLRAAFVVASTLLFVGSSTASAAEDLTVCQSLSGDEAIAACSRLIASGNLKGSDLGRVYLGRGLARDAKDDLKGAIADYDQAIRLDPKDALAYQARSFSRRNKGDLDGAIADYEQGIKIDPKAFVPWYANDLAGDAYRRRDYATAMRLLRTLANQGDPVAQSNLGIMYENGEGVSQDYAEAARFYRLAADQGFAGAQFHLGLMYLSGHGVPRNDTEALRLYRLAAEQGSADGQKALGLIYFNGLAGVPQNYTEAVRWYTLAAEQGEPLAQSELGAAHKYCSRRCFH
jgi:tetratricopeptide (TPR) repeat protein